MSHSDEKGLVLPPKIAPIQIVITPIKYHEESVKKAVDMIKEKLRVFSFYIDDRDSISPGAKYYEWEKKGVPIRIEVGPRDVSNSQCIIARRDTSEKCVCSFEEINGTVEKILDSIQNNLFNKALEQAKKVQELPTICAPPVNTVQDASVYLAGTFAERTV